MSRQLFDHLGQPLRRGNRLAGGGEGVVFFCKDDTQVVIKLYHNSLSQEHEAKLATMVQLASQSLAKVAAWPLSTIHDKPGGRIIGLTMPYVSNAYELHELYSPTARREKFPDATWKFLIHVAANCARAFATIHDAGVVVGDVNQKNVLVAADGTVRLLDCDSFQLSTSGKTFFCRVGVPEFTPPELHGQRLDSVPRSPTHDGFGLAVLIFHLLFMGRHPFAGRFTGTGEMPLDRAIREGRFAYSRFAHRYQMCAPPHVPALRIVTDQVAEMFQAAFVREARSNRPTAKDWVSALDILKKRLVECASDPCHLFSAGGATCPWCDLASMGGPNFFAVASMRKKLGTAQFIDVTAVWNSILASRFSIEVPLPPPNPQPVPPLSSPPDMASYRSFSKTIGTIAIIAIVVTFCGILLRPLALFGFPIAIVFGGWWAVWQFLSPLRRELKASASKVEETVAAIENTRGATSRRLLSLECEVSSHFRRLEGLYNEHRQLDSSRQKAMIELDQEAQSRQLDEWLRSRFIAQSNITGIGPTRSATLASYAIETAYDVDFDKICMLPGFGVSLAANLVAWRKSEESRFRYDPRRGVPQSDRDAVEIRFALRRRQIESELVHGARTVEHAFRQAEKMIAECQKKLQEDVDRHYIAQEMHKQLLQRKT